MKVALPIALVWLQVAAAPVLGVVDPFYLAVESDARAAALRGDPKTAARLYRIACFGMLDEPNRLGACTVRLALAQFRSGDRVGFQASWNRLAIIQERFQGLTRAGVESSELGELARVASAWLGPEMVGVIPALAEAPSEGRASDRSGDEDPARSGERSVEQGEPRAMVGDDRGLGAGQAGPRDTDADISTAGAATRPSEEARTKAAAIRELLAGAPTNAQLQAAIEEMRPLTAAWPDEAEFSRLAGELAYRAASWRTCADSFRRAGPPSVDEPAARFYMAVCLFEIGSRDEAAEILRPIAARLRRKPFVDDYLQRILGAEPSP